jgi:hypothetical protein
VAYDSRSRQPPFAPVGTGTPDEDERPGRIGSCFGWAILESDRTRMPATGREVLPETLPLPYKRASSSAARVDSDKSIAPAMSSWCPRWGITQRRACVTSFEASDVDTWAMNTQMRNAAAARFLRRSQI